MKLFYIVICIFFFFIQLISCSVDYSILENRRCDNEGRCLGGYVCDRRTMLCVKPDTIITDVDYIDIVSDTAIIDDRGVEDIQSDVTCTPTNNGVEICDGIDNDCDGRTDEEYTCRSCTITESINEPCDENTSCNKCFIVNGIKYICISKNGSDFQWISQSDVECNSSMEDKIIRCENRCFLCKDGKYQDPFFLQNESCDGNDNNCNGITDEGDICPPYMICISGKCVEKQCLANEDCPEGKICKEDKCVTCTDTIDDDLCGPSKICVNGSCIDGDCHADSDCSGGICVSNKCCIDCCRGKKDCPEEKVCKDSKCTTCVDLWDDWNCGSGYICVDGKCIKGTCHPSLGCLWGKICVNYNCCEPGPSCCNEDEHCKSNMTCTSSHTCECKPLFGDCNNKYNDGCEKDLSTDVNNCGICNQKCTLPNAEPVCIGGVCKIKNCKANYKDCDLQSSNGCEISTPDDAKNCGDCGIVCEAANAETKCENSKCKIKQCNLGFADCNQNYEDGCEINISSDNKNCGDCNKTCPSNKNCINGSCN